MSYSYQAFGLHILSNTPIQYLAAAPNKVQPDVVIEFRYLSAAEAAAGRGGWDFGFPEKTIRDIGVDVFHDGPRQKLRVFRPDGRYFEFIVTAETVAVSIPDDIPEMDPVSFLLGPVLSVVCRLRYLTCLHASVLAFDGNAFALVGDKGAGKSTTAAMLLKLGAELVADDAAILHVEGEQVSVQPGYPYMRLSPEVMARTRHNRKDAAPVLSVGDKYYLSACDDMGMQAFTSGPVPLVRVYALSARLEDSYEIGINEIKPTDALRCLTANAHVPYVMNDRMRKNDFEVFGMVARAGRVKGTDRPDDLDMLKPFCQEILDDFRRQKCR